MNNDGVAALCKEQLKQSKQDLGSQYKNTNNCYAYYDADDSSYKDTIQFVDTEGQRKKAEVVFNQIKSNVDAVAGFMAQNRRQAKYSARIPNSKVAEMYSRYKNALYDFHRDNTNADQLETEQDADMLICGYGAIETDLSYIVGNSTTNPYGELIKLKLDPVQVGWDARAKGTNLLDARWVYYHQDHDLKDALELFQNSKEEDFSSVGDDETDPETGYEYNPYGGLYDKIKLLNNVEWSSQKNERVRVYNHQWFQYETFYRAPNPLFAFDDLMDVQFAQARLEIIASEIKKDNPEYIDYDDMFTLDPSAEELVFDDKTKKVLEEEFGELETIPYKRKCFYTAVLSGSHVFSWFKSISQQGFSVKFKTGIYNRTKKIWVGMVNVMMQPQKYHNKSLTELMFIIAANSKGGVMVEEDAVEDIKAFEKQYAKTDAVIKVRAGALGQGKVQPKAQPALPTGLESIVTLSEQAITKNGVDPAFMGSLEREDQSGILYKRRIRQVISKMARYFDSITLYQKEDARLCSDLIRVWTQNNAGQFVRVAGEDGAEEYLQVSEDNLADEYDVSIEEAAQTPEDRQETAQVINQMGDKFLAVGDAPTAKTFFAESLSFLPIDADSKSRLMKALQPNQETVPMEQYMQLQQLVEQLQSEQAQLAASKVQSEIDKNQASVNKTSADIAKTLEEAAATGLENDLIRQGDYETPTVNI